jgi:cobalt/nickel transport system permease protein
MADRLLSPYHHRASPVHRGPAGVKVGGAMAVVLAVVLLPRAAWTVYLAGGAVLAGLAALSRVPPRALLRRVLLLEPFVIGVAALSLLQRGGGVVFLSMLAKSTLCVSAMVLLSATTRFSDLLGVAWRLRLPPLLVTSLALMSRYLTLLVDEAGRMTRARRSRSFLPGRAHAWRGSATVAAQLFVRSSERAERVYAAMCARGWRT